MAERSRKTSASEAGMTAHRQVLTDALEPLDRACQWSSIVSIKLFASEEPARSRGVQPLEYHASCATAPAAVQASAQKCYDHSRKKQRQSLDKDITADIISFKINIFDYIVQYDYSFV